MKQIFVIHNFVNIPESKLLNQNKFENNIVFVGKMDYDPNILAVSFFAKHVFPKLKEIYPNVIFNIVGAKPSKEVIKLGKNEGVNVTGFVDSVDEYFKKATIVVAPMLTGAGIQNKIIQAMSYGCCVATTSIGAEGLSLETEPCIILNSKEEWINGMIDLLGNQERRISIGKRGRIYVEKEFSIEMIRREFNNFIDYPLKK